ncbi:hypothetical protein [Phormidium sp. CCY1219]|jgi:hypothetical protein|uniref:hypothetical protein n=1 Tax=Phormidium sp. CCY1219 TaxID=2886104 RepID=UPI002D1F684C|nr:hypothetical protein [Phormidium sp. CCY1219]MEB3827558.1 hypothetical protein [Phormidium sp. CCY1219]
MYSTSVPEPNLPLRLEYDGGSISAKTSILAENDSSSYNTDSVDLRDVQEPITSAPTEVRQIIERVLQAEKDKLYMKIPRNINDDILNIVKEAIQ